MSRATKQIPPPPVRTIPPPPPVARKVPPPPPVRPESAADRRLLSRLAKAEATVRRLTDAVHEQARWLADLEERVQGYDDARVHVLENARALNNQWREFLERRRRGLPPAPIPEEGVADEHDLEAMVEEQRLAQVDR